MKKTISLLLAVAMLFALAACSAGSKPGEPVNPGQKDSAKTDTEIPVETGVITDPQPTDELESGVKTLEEPDFDTVLADSNIDPHDVDTSGLNAFIRATMPQIFSGLNGENRVYSPLNVYIALGMLSEVTGGETNKQITDVLGTTDMDSLRKSICSLWMASYQNDVQEDWPTATIVPAASIWLRNGSTYKDGALQALADYYFASSFSGPMGSDEYTAKLREWVNERTNHLLEEQANGLSLDSDTVIALVTTLYFKSSWVDKFYDSNTSDDIFHAEHGDETVPFMHGLIRSNYCEANHFKAVYLPMYGGTGMWIMLPNDGYSVEDLAVSEEAMAFMLADSKRDMDRMPDVDIALPKFDVTSDVDLCSVLASLGMTDVFDPDKSDFTPLTDTPYLAVSDIEHAARVKIDEEGCEAAAFTAIMVKDAAFMPTERIEFVCDRPFMFIITGPAEQLLFTGVVNTIAE